MATFIKTRAGIEDLHEIEGKAELVNGEIILMSPTGDKPGLAGGNVFVSLHHHSRATRTGLAVPDNVGFLAGLPHREVLCPDVAYYTGPRGGADFFPRSPVFAVEVRSKNDYGKEAERKIKAKTADYFAAGTLVVWDADVLREKIIRKYCSTDPDNPTVFRRGEVADAEPAVPGWTFPVDELFS